MNVKSSAYIQAIRGPVLLVTVGVLFAIHQAGGLAFSRTWPLLIIVIGVMKLLERAWAPALPYAGNRLSNPYGVEGAPGGAGHPNPRSTPPGR